MLNRERRALLLAAVQAADLAVAHYSSNYGTEHLDRLGVPRRLRPALPIVKATAVAGLAITAKRQSRRSLAGAALVSYYSAAVAFHILSGDGLRDALPAAACAGLAASIVS